MIDGYIVDLGLSDCSKNDVSHDPKEIAEVDHTLVVGIVCNRVRTSSSVVTAVVVSTRPITADGDVDYD